MSQSIHTTAGRLAIIAAAAVITANLQGAQATTAPDAAAPRASAPTAPDQAATALPEGDRAYTQADAERWRDEVIEAVEAVAGKPFRSAPVVKVMGRSEFLDHLVQEQMFYAKAMNPDVDPEEAELGASLEALSLAGGLLGHTSLRTGEIMLPAGNILPIMQLSEIPSDRLEPVMKLVVAHELAHALRNQYVDMRPQIAGIRTSDELKALRATDEGFAMLVQEEVAKRLNLDAAQDQCIEMISLRSIADPRLESARRHYTEIYEAGLHFFQAHAVGGMDNAWLILARPPVTYAQIREPSSYGQAVAMEMNLAWLFAGLADIAADRPWMERSLTIDGEQVASPFRPLGTKVTAEVVQGVAVAHSSMRIDRSGTMPQVFSVTCYELDDPAFGATLLGHIAALREVHFSTIRQVTADPNVTVQERDATSLPEGSAQESHLYQITMDEKEPGGTGSMAYQMTIATASQDRFVVQLVANGDPIDDRSVAAAISSVLDRAVVGSAMTPIPTADEADPMIQALQALAAFLPDGQWTHECREMEKARIEQLVGKDIPGSIAMEMGLVNAQVCSFERPTNTPPGDNITAILVRVNDPEFAEPLANAVAKGFKGFFDRFSAVPGASMQFGDLEKRTITDRRIEVEQQAITLLLPNQGPQALFFTSARRGAYFIQLSSSGDALTLETTDAFLIELFADLPSP